MFLSELAVNQLKNLPQQNSQLVRVLVQWAVYWTSSVSLHPYPWQKNVGLEGTAFQFLLATALASGFTNLNYRRWREGPLQWFQGLWETRRWFRTPLLLLC